MCTIQPSDVKKVKPSPPLYTDKSKAKVKQSKRFVFCHPHSLSPVIIYISNSLPHSSRTHLIYVSFYAPYVCNSRIRFRHIGLLRLSFNIPIHYIMAW